MKNIWTLAFKELRIYFTSPIVYVVAMVFLAVSDYLFVVPIYRYASMFSQITRFRGGGELPEINLHEAVFRPAYLSMGVVLLLMIPCLTMRLLAEEKKGKTLELLLTSPIRLSEIVLGKFLGACLVYAFLLLLTLHQPLVLMGVTTVAWKLLLTSYLGLLLMGGLLIAWGLFASALTENQIIAAVTSFGLLIGFWLIGAMAQSTGETATDSVLHYLSVTEHLDNFIKGLIDTRDITYFVSMILLGLFLTHRVLESHRWKSL